MKKYLIACGLTAALSMAGWTAAASGIDAPQLFNKSCASCHGKDGKGETKAGQKAKVKDFTKVEYQKRFTDEEAFKNLKFGKKDGDREVKKPFSPRLSDEEIKALVAYVRTFAE